MEHFNVIVIGSGPAGRRAAVQSAKLGKSVLVVENRLRLGGVSVHTGTIPSKTLRETVLNLSGWRERGFYGLSYRVKKDIEGKDLGARLRMTLDHEIEVLEHQFARNGVRTFGGMARFVDTNAYRRNAARWRRDHLQLRPCRDRRRHHALSARPISRSTTIPLSIATAWSPSRACRAA